ncbi:hypothetical protein [Neobacillus sp. PS3-40]|uniref:hypothetical protein n=1 Tax=Neobacillus sp. PS3-40 TaxID=3070679 RepID=UPI0027DF5755|nr:hypothetical protein [Neobacillus sp. PS3-40]WML44357.1 hypothetical protein RCG20_00080 [Neobacillus sp. PS3-40]
MKNSKLFLVAMLILPLLTLPLLGRNVLKKYLPAAIFICILTKILDTFGERKNWWRFYKGIPPLDSMDMLNFGPYFVSSLWLLKMTYGKFPLYLISNTILHILFIFLGIKYIKRLRILSLVKLTKFQYLAIDFIRALLLYVFQFLKEKAQGEVIKSQANLEIECSSTGAL